MNDSLIFGIPAKTGESGYFEKKASGYPEAFFALW
jgi:hypothetical protein